MKMTELDAKIQVLTQEIEKLRAGFPGHKKMDSTSQAMGNGSIQESTEKLPLPPKYDGSLDFNTYLVQFEVLAKEQRWSDQKCGVMLLSRLKGRALDIAAQGEDLTYPQLVSRLKSHFSPEHEEMFAQKLDAIQKNANQTWEDLAFEVRTLTVKAYREANESTRERLGVHAFVNAISDDTLRQKVRDAHPVSIQAALDRVRQVEADQVIEQQRHKQVPEKDPVHVVQRDAYQKRVQELEQEVKDLRTKVEAKQVKGQENPEAGRVPRPGSRRGYYRPSQGWTGFQGRGSWRGFQRGSWRGAFSQRRCYSCGSLDHFGEKLSRKSCLETTEVPEPVREWKFCFQFHSQLPHSAFKLGQAAPVSRGAAKSQTQAEPKGYFTDGYAEDIPVHWLIDTGCTITILSLKKYLEIPEDKRPELYKHERVLVTADDKPLNVYGQTTFNVKFGSQWVRHTALVAEITNDGLIGMDFLTEHKVSLDFGSQKITFRGEDLEAQCNSTQERACRIAVSEGVVIPAGTRMIVQAKASHPLATGSWLVEPLQRIHGEKPVLLARTLIQGDGLKLPVEVMNPTNEDTYLYPNTNVGIASRVCSVDPVQSTSTASSILPEEVSKLADEADVPLNSFQKKQVETLLYVKIWTCSPFLESPKEGPIGYSMKFTWRQRPLSSKL